MTGDDAVVVDRLDRMIAILQLAFAAEIAAAKTAVRADAVNAAVLEATAEDWIKSGEIQRRVADATGTSTRTVRARLQDLLTMQAIVQRGSGPATEYRATGLL